MDEGYIKFNSEWEKKTSLSFPKIKKLNHWRQQMYNVKLVGAYSNGIGYGNVSQRAEGNDFYISGSKTGNYIDLDERYYSKVIDFDIQKNWVKCTGGRIASSESMSHAVIYQQHAHVNAVLHVHHAALWKKLLWKIPTTPKAAPYGSPEIANEIIELFKTTDVLEQKIFAMAGHEQGLFVFGETLEEAGAIILGHLERLKEED